ncbi:hypothetical protein Tco_0630846 [Tanacetum coccineum]
MVRDTIQLETAVSTISQEYLLEFTSEYGITEDLHPELPGPGDRIVDFPEGKVGVYTKFFEFANFRIPISQFHFDILGHYQIYLSQLSVIGAATVDERVFPTIMDWRTNAPKDEMPVEGSYRFVQFDPCSEPQQEMEEPAAATKSSGIPSTIERSPLDFANENPSQQITVDDGMEDQVQGIVASEFPPPENVTTSGIAPETDLAEEVTAMGPRVSKKCRKRENDGVDVNAPPKVLRKDHAASRPTQSTAGGKSLASVGLETGSTFPVPAPLEIPADMSDPDPLSYANPQLIPERDVAQSSRGAAVAGDPESENTSFASIAGSPGNIYQPGWGVTNGCRLDTPEACQDLVDHLAPPGYFSELRHLPNDDFGTTSGNGLAATVEIKNLEALPEAEADMKKFAEAKNAELVKELESLRDQFIDLQVRNDRISQQVSTLQAQVTGEEKLKAAFEEFKKYEDDRVEKRCAEMDTRLDALSIDFDEELYPHMLTAITSHQWVIRHGLHLAVMKCAESAELRQAFADVVSARIAKGISKGLKHGVEHRKASLDLEVIEAYDPDADTKYVAALHALRDLKYPMVDQLESLKDAPIDVIMASLHLESDSGEDAPYWIHELRPSSSQLKIPVYPKVRDPKKPWSFKEEILLEDAIMANVSRARKKKKCRVVCRTHGVGSAHQAMPDGVPVSVPTVAPQGLAILLADATTQTETFEDEASPRLFGSKSLPPTYNLDWP